MDILLWVLTGAATAWATYSLLGMNQERGLMVALGIGAMGGFFGGSIVAPLLASASDATGQGHSSALLAAAVVAAGFLAVGNLIAKRWGV